MKGTTEEARLINSYLDLLKSKMLDVQMNLIHKNRELSIENFKEMLFGYDEKTTDALSYFSRS